MLNLLLAIVGGVFGLAATGGAVYAAWVIAAHRRPQFQTQPDPQQAALGSQHMHNTAVPDARPSVPYPPSLLRWTWLDYIVLGLSVFGFLLLLADAVAVVRDRDSYPGYHYSYLICGVILAFMGMLMTFMRLFMLVHAIRAARKHL